MTAWHTSRHQHGHRKVGCLTHAFIVPCASDIRYPIRHWHFITQQLSSLQKHLHNALGISVVANDIGH